MPNPWFASKRRKPRKTFPPHIYWWERETDDANPSRGLDASIVRLVIYIISSCMLWRNFNMFGRGKNRSRTRNLHVQFACIVLHFDFAVRPALFLLQADFLLLLLLSTPFFPAWNSTLSLIPVQNVCHATLFSQAVCECMRHFTFTLCDIAFYTRW